MSSVVFVIIVNITKYHYEKKTSATLKNIVWSNSIKFYE